MQRLVDWLTASPARVLFGAALLATLGYVLSFLLMTWLPGALLVLLALRGGPNSLDWQAALVAGVTLGWWLLEAFGAGPVPTGLVAIGLIVPPLLIGRFLARGGTLSLAFQFSTLAALATLLAVHLLLTDPPGVWRPAVERLAAELDRVAAMMAQGGPWPDSKKTAAAVVNWGSVAWLLLFNAMAATAVGLYAFGRLTRSVQLGPAFRALTAGRTLALAALVTTALTMTVRWDFASDAERVFLGAFVLQGLALVHAAREILGLNPGWLVATYALLFVPLAQVVVPALLAAAGVLDNWMPIRSRLAALVAKNDAGGG